MQKFLCLQRDDFIKYVVRPQCSAIYTYEDCVSESGHTKSSKCCSKSITSTSKCGALLLRIVELAGGKKSIIPL